jgi:hypothetical protein
MRETIGGLALSAWENQETLFLKNKDEEDSNSRSNSKTRQSKPEQYSEEVGGYIRVGVNGRVSGKGGS